MKRTILIFIALIGFYTLGRNNILVFPEGIVWESNTDIFHKVFLPLLMLSSAVVSFIKKDSINFFYLSFTAMVFDAVNRLALFVNHYYVHFTYDPAPTLNYSGETVIMVINYWPSHTMLFIEAILIFVVFWRWKGIGAGDKS